ncbi:unnamed protein product [Brachionus calyciflorus]|uniref:Ion transport domain-containing protein n=1 Tax=Brachionus calyciflorus TaxID=104777 RepID=A0A814FUZ0_9BILA|nr:unnamed protein product [Brachionus calyciflorus]
MEEHEKESYHNSVSSLIYLKEFEDRKFLSKNAELFHKLFLNHLTEVNLNNNIRFKYNELLNNPSSIIDKQPVQFNIYHDKIRDQTNESFNEGQVYSYQKSFYKQKKILNKLVKSKKFEFFLLILLIADSISKAYFVNDNNLETNQIKIINLIQSLYLITFLLEVSIKLFVDFELFWKSPWNVFDLVNLIISFFLEMVKISVDVVQSNSNLFKFLKILTVFRIFTNVKILSHFVELRIIIICLTKAVRSVVLISILLFIFTYIFSKIGFTLFSNTHNDTKQVNDYFSSIFESIITLFAIMTLDQWWKIFTNTDPESLLTTFYFISWVILASFIFQNLFTGVMVNNFQQIREEVVQSLDLKRLKQAQKESIRNENEVYRQKYSEASEMSETERIRSQNKEWCQLIEESSEIIKNLENNTIWPEDTLIRFYELMQILMDNLKERMDLIDLANESLISMHDRDNLLSTKFVKTV